MGYIYYLIPNWFFGFDIAMEVLFSFITLAVAFASFYIFKLSKERSHKLFGVSFLLIGFSYLVWAITNLLVVTKVTEGFRELDISKLALLGMIGIYAHVLLFSIGLVTLLYTTFNIKKGGIYYLLLGLSLLVVMSSLNKFITFKILSIFLLSFIVYHFFLEWEKYRNKKTLNVLIAFTLLLVSAVDFTFSRDYYQAYVIGHFLELGAYILLLINLIKTIKQ